jgi:hypothetical protein
VLHTHLRVPLPAARQGVYMGTEQFTNITAAIMVLIAIGVVRRPCRACRAAPAGCVPAALPAALR